MSYQEQPVHAALRDLAVCTWIDEPGEARHAVVPDACIDIVWDGRRLEVAGPDTRPFPLDRTATFVGIRFRPGAAPRVLGVDACDLLDLNVGLRDLWGPVADELATQLAEAGSQAGVGLLERAVLTRAAAAQPDRLITGLLGLLSGGAALDGLAETLGVSERTLRRRCVTAVGYGPKMLERVLRFRRALGLIRACVPLVQIAPLAGYADQAHLTNEFQRLAGATPGHLSRQPHVPMSSNGLSWSVRGRGSDYG